MNSSPLKARTIAGCCLAMCVLLSLGCPPASDESTVSSNGSGNDSLDSTNDQQGPDVQTENAPNGSNPVGDQMDPIDDANERANADATSNKEYDREPLFVDWQEPQIALFISGRQNGYIEPCGCTGLANQKGGLLRRHTLYKQLQEKGWEVLPLDVGNQIRRFGMQPVIKFTRTFEALTQFMDYEAISLGPDDLRIDAIEIFQTLANYQKDFNPLVSANVRVLDDLLLTHRIIEANGLRVGVTAVLGDEYQAGIHNPDVNMDPMEQGLATVVPELTNQDCDFLVLLAFTSIESCERLAETYPYFDVIVSAGPDGEPTREPMVVRQGSHETHLVQTGYKGMHVGVVGLSTEGGKSIQYQRVPLDVRFTDSPELQPLFSAYQDQLKSLGLDGLDLRPVSHPSGQSYVGSAECKDCHSIAYDIWENGVDGLGGPHHHATTSLVEPGERTWVQRHHDPECLSCHVTGWNPQNYYPYEGGYLDLDLSAKLHGNGCENCHGPGSRHVAAEWGELDISDDEVYDLQLAMRVTEEEAKANLCIECHDLDNSPDFHEDGAWEKYWSRIKHIGKD